MKIARTYLQENVFTPHWILNNMDLAGGTLNLKAYGVLYKCEREAKDPYKCPIVARGGRGGSTVLSHEWKIRQACDKLHALCDRMIPMKHYVTENGECVSFKDIVDITKTICKAFGLDHVAQNRLIDLALTLDGAQLTNKISFVMASLKLIDLEVDNPENGEYELNHLLCDPKKFKNQSRKWCFPYKLCMGKESEKMYQEEFCELFELFRQAGLPMQQIFLEWKGVRIANPADMAAIQKVLGIGGAAKVYNFFVIAVH